MDDLTVCSVDCKTGDQTVRPMTADEAAAHLENAVPTPQNDDNPSDPLASIAAVVADAADPAAALRDWATGYLASQAG